MRPSAAQALESVVASDCASWDPLVGRGGKTDSCHSKTLIALIILSPETAANIPPKHLLTIFYLWNRQRSGIWTHVCKKSSNSNKFHSKIIGTKVWNSHRGRDCSGVSSSSPSVSTKEFLDKIVLWPKLYLPNLAQKSIFCLIHFRSWVFWFWFSILSPFRTWIGSQSWGRLLNVISTT